MTIEISQETEHRLTAEAQRRGISVDTLLQQLINDRAVLTTQGKARPELPVWHLGSTGAYHRSDTGILGNI
jgi:hypothetical protein